MYPCKIDTEHSCPCATQPSSAAGASNTVLLAVADAAQREMMAGCLASEGLAVLEAAGDGSDLFPLCGQRRPWLLIVDLERMAGQYELFHACRQHLCHPVTVLLAPLDKPHRTAHFLTLAADDLLPDPCPEAVFRLRLNLLLRFRHHQTKHPAPALSGGAVASRRAPNIHHLFHASTPHGSDVFLIGQGAKHGHQIVLAGDLNRCGAAATRAALCLAQNFSDALRRHSDVVEVIRLVHFGLIENLPGISVPAMALELDPAKKRLKLWNGGLPDALVWQHDEETLHTLPPHSLPLGEARHSIGKELHELPLQQDDRLYFYTESLHTARITPEWLKTSLAGMPAPERFRHIHTELDNRLAENQPGQDVTFAEIAPYDRRRRPRD